ncbi:MAG: MurR/RpiR family transcriptional regulator [Piscinibacter sp.]|nr:MurR/RpiR family transcriptional regulator [Piscinibacter sp.]
MSPATTFEDFAATVSAAFPRLSPQQQVIAQYVLEHPDAFALGTAATVAEAAGVQPSALVRFANVMEFSGFSEMQQLFKSRLLERAGSYRQRIGAMRGNADATDAEGVLHRFADDGIADLRQLGRSVPAEALERAARLLSRARRIHVLAQRRAFPIASYLAYALGQLDLKVQLLDGIGGMLMDSLRQLERGEVLLVASFKNYSPQVIEAAQQAHAKGLQVVAITDHALSPLKPSAAVCFELGQGPSAGFRSLVAPMCLAQALVVSTGQQLVSPRRTRRSNS